MDEVLLAVPSGIGRWFDIRLVLPGLVPGIHVFFDAKTLI
jgi:hypothetical protein